MDLLHKDLKKFEVVALGCNERAHKCLRDFFHQAGTDTYQFVEYFLLSPLFYPLDKDYISKSKIYFPFLRRLILQSYFLPQETVSNICQVIPRIKEEIDIKFRPQRFILPLDRAMVGKKVFKHWLDNSPQGWQSSKSFPYNMVNSKKDWENHERFVKQTPEPYRDPHLLEYDLVGRFWSWSPVKSVVAAYPIASSNGFYGYFVLIWPKHEKVKVDEARLCNLLARLSEQIYYPTLLLLHESLWENYIFSMLDNKVDIEELKNKIKFIPLYKLHLSEAEIMERALCKLWHKRYALLENKNLEKLKETLLLAKYNIASPGMIDEIKKVMAYAPRLHPPAQKESLPTALIYGEAGSGKDTMAKLIPLFTESAIDKDEKQKGYFGSEIRVINMAALKPNAIVGPLLLGVKVDKTEKALSSLGSILVPEKKDEGMVYIFDELNSLDVDLQGILLRILENGEVTALFGVEPCHVKHLIIGIVNEDPEAITKEEEFKSLQRLEAFFGRMLKTMLYETFWKGRRLRPDLFYRLKRFLYIKLPPLRGRREDIPILFYFQCLKEVKLEWENILAQIPLEKKNKIDFDLDIEFEAFMELMRPDLDWPGNIRQLQAVAKEATTEVTKGLENRIIENLKKGIEKPIHIEITREIVEEVLSRHFEVIRRERQQWKGGKV